MPTYFIVACAGFMVCAGVLMLALAYAIFLEILGDGE